MDQQHFIQMEEEYGGLFKALIAMDSKLAALRSEDAKTADSLDSIAAELE